MNNPYTKGLVVATGVVIIATISVTYSLYNLANQLSNSQESINKTLFEQTRDTSITIQKLNDELNKTKANEEKAKDDLKTEKNKFNYGA